jgi:hypothetical protein
MRSLLVFAGWDDCSHFIPAAAVQCCAQRHVRRQRNSKTRRRGRLSLLILCSTSAIYSKPPACSQTWIMAPRSGGPRIEPLPCTGPQPEAASRPHPHDLNAIWWRDMQSLLYRHVTPCPPSPCVTQTDPDRLLPPWLFEAAVLTRRLEEVEGVAGWRGLQARRPHSDTTSDSARTVAAMRLTVGGAGAVLAAKGLKGLALGLGSAGP